MDGIWWAYSTVTTVGYGDIIPTTFQGRILGILLMLMGTAMFATYIALFAEVILKSSLFPHFELNSSKTKTSKKKLD